MYPHSQIIDEPIPELKKTDSNSSVDFLENEQNEQNELQIDAEALKIFTPEK